jgi:hypothetical protein
LASLRAEKEVNSLGILQISVDSEVVFTKLQFFLTLFKEGVLSNTNADEKLSVCTTGVTY